MVQIVCTQRFRRWSGKTRWDLGTADTSTGCDEILTSCINHV
eukprot:SAG11_NODE_16886_length_534_cov_1.218391_1_plen_41_part_10